MFYRDWMLPGDTFNLHATILARLSSTALTKPVMDNMYLETFFFCLSLAFSVVERSQVFW